MTLEQFLYMGGYGDYVWGAYALGFIILVANIIIPLLNKRNTIKMIKTKVEHDKNDA